MGGTECDHFVYLYQATMTEVSCLLPEPSWTTGTERLKLEERCIILKARREQDQTNK